MNPPGGCQSPTAFEISCKNSALRDGEATASEHENAVELWCQLEANRRLLLTEILLPAELEFIASCKLQLGLCLGGEIPNFHTRGKYARDTQPLG
jgi:hypothetical protein